ncbi:MAG TPA: hypothetical protein VE573_03400 [Nitrososphaeraceae archaeon]|jgi:hypothetical protein|nr:hypothetical protein [Nitrososphaeraceae archaeon]
MNIPKGKNASADGTPAEKVLTEIEIKIQTSKNRFEIELLRSILLGAGITCLSNQNSKISL